MAASNAVVDDDGLPMPPTRFWSLDKHSMVRYYDEIFATSMREKWNIVYLDLFAGAGYAQVKETGNIVKTSSLLALGIQHPFHHHVFCERSAKWLNALKLRVARDHPTASASFILGDCNLQVAEVIQSIRGKSNHRQSLVFCFVDPFNLGIHFSTIAKLEASLGRIDFMLLLALWMDARRNEAIYLRPDSKVIERLLGDPDWRQLWESQRARNSNFGKFVADQFARKMFTLRYENVGERQMAKFTTSDTKVPLYHLAFFSKHPLGYKYWYEVQKRARGQTALPL